MELDFTEGNDEIGLPVIQMKHLALDPRHFRYLLSKGWTFLLTHSLKPLALVRPITEEDLIKDEKMAPDERAVLMTLEEIRKNRDKFLFTLKDGIEIFIFWKNKANREKGLAVVSSTIPEEVLNAYKEFREAGLLRTKEKKKSGVVISAVLVHTSEFTNDLTSIRQGLSNGEEFILYDDEEIVGYIRPLTEQDPEEFESKGVVFRIISFETISENCDEFLGTIKDGPVVLGYMAKAIAVLSPEIPQEYLEKFMKAQEGKQKEVAALK